MIDRKMLKIMRLYLNYIECIHVYETFIFKLLLLFKTYFGSPFCFFKPINVIHMLKHERYFSLKKN